MLNGYYSVPLFSQLFQNFQERGLKQNENFYFQAPEEEYRKENRNPKAGMHHPCEDNLSEWQWYPLVKGEIIIESLSKKSLKVKGVVACLLV